jgi:hypothetical protein
MNFYGTLEDARRIALSRFSPNSDFKNLGDEDFQNLLTQASEMIDAQLDFVGERAVPGSVLAWPRVINGVVVPVPKQVIKASVLQAQYLFELITEAEQSSNLRRIEISTFKFETHRPQSVYEIGINPMAMDLLKEFIAVANGGNNTIQFKVFRGSC